jgi:PKD repeat protein
LGNGNTAGDTLTPTNAYTIPGTYTVTLTVTDDGVGSDTLTVVVHAPLTPTPTATPTPTSTPTATPPPTVAAGPDQTADEGDEVSFSGTVTDGLNTYTVEWRRGFG